VTFKEVQRVLIGWLSPVGKEDFEELERCNHPSLYGHKRKGGYYILIGALSLVNHCCGATAVFGTPTTPG
jgi:hypothetical protein